LVMLPMFQRILLLPSSASKKNSQSPFTNPHGLICHNISIFHLSALLNSRIVSSRYNLDLRSLIAWRAFNHDLQQHPASIWGCSSQRLLPSRIQNITTMRTTIWFLLQLKPLIVYSTDGGPSLAFFHILCF
jgi:hypothetical protein